MKSLVEKSKGSTIDLSSEIFLDFQLNIDKEYLKFQSKIICSDLPLLGVRTPVIKDLLKKYLNKKEYENDLLDYCLKKHSTYEENLFAGLLLTKLKITEEKRIQSLTQFLSCLDSWATVDSTISSLKVAKKNPNLYLPFFRSCVENRSGYARRFGIIGCMVYGLSEEGFMEDQKKMKSAFEDSFYYVKMGLAWYYCEGLIQHYSEFYPLFKTNELPLWVHNKAIQKSIESYRLDDIEKEELRRLKRKMTILENTSYTNLGKMGDQDGPAYVVYSKIGYNKASMDLYFSNCKLNLVKKDGKHVNAYAFLGIDIYDPITKEFVNCADTGLVSEGNGKWHIFHNVLNLRENENQSFWYESNIELDGTHNYRLELDSSYEDDKALLKIYDLSDNLKIVDVHEMPMPFAKKDGSNTDYLMNFAIDYPEDVCKNLKEEDCRDWDEITLYNSKEEICFENLLVSNAKLWKNQNEYAWTEEHTECRSIWPDKKITRIQRKTTKIEIESMDTRFIVHFDMKRKEI